jgi:hypothetical protein
MPRNDLGYLPDPAALSAEIPPRPEGYPIFNLYDLTTNQQAIRDVARAMTDSLPYLADPLPTT